MASCYIFASSSDQFINVSTNQIFNTLQSALLVKIVSTYDESDSGFALSGLTHSSKNSLQKHRSKYM